MSKISVNKIALLTAMLVIGGIDASAQVYSANLRCVERPECTALGYTQADSGEERGDCRAWLNCPSVDESKSQSGRYRVCSDRATNCSALNYTSGSLGDWCATVTPCPDAPSKTNYSLCSLIKMPDCEANNYTLAKCPDNAFCTQCGIDGMMPGTTAKNITFRIDKCDQGYQINGDDRTKCVIAPCRYIEASGNTPATQYATSANSCFKTGEKGWSLGNTLDSYSADKGCYECKANECKENYQVSADGCYETGSLGWKIDTTDLTLPNICYNGDTIKYNCIKNICDVKFQETVATCGTKGAAGYNIDTTIKTADNICYEGDTIKYLCRENKVDDSYQVDASGCGKMGALGYELDKEDVRYAGETAKYKCVPLTCNKDYNSKYQKVSDCGITENLGWEYKNDAERYNGEANCGQCNKLECKEGFDATLQDVGDCGTKGALGWSYDYDEKRYHGDDNCGACEKLKCETGYTEDFQKLSDCGSEKEWVYSNDEKRYHGDANCGRCTCPLEEDAGAYTWDSTNVGDGKVDGDKGCNDKYNKCDVSNCTAANYPATATTGMATYDECTACREATRYKALTCETGYNLDNGVCTPNVCDVQYKLEVTECGTTDGWALNDTDPCYEPGLTKKTCTCTLDTTPGAYTWDSSNVGFDGLATGTLGCNNKYNECDVGICVAEDYPYTTNTGNAGVAEYGSCTACGTTLYKATEAEEGYELDDEGGVKPATCDVEYKSDKSECGTEYGWDLSETDYCKAGEDTFHTCECTLKSTDKDYKWDDSNKGDATLTEDGCNKKYKTCTPNETEVDVPDHATGTDTSDACGETFYIAWECDTGYVEDTAGTACKVATCSKGSTTNPYDTDIGVSSEGTGEYSGTDECKEWSCTAEYLFNDSNKGDGTLSGDVDCEGNSAVCTPNKTAKTVPANATGSGKFSACGEDGLFTGWTCNAGYVENANKDGCDVATCDVEYVTKKDECGTEAGWDLDKTDSCQTGSTFKYTCKCTLASTDKTYKWDDKNKGDAKLTDLGCNDKYKTCTPNKTAKTVPSHATGTDTSDACGETFYIAWECNDGYTINSDQTGCDVATCPADYAIDADECGQTGSDGWLKGSAHATAKSGTNTCYECIKRGCGMGSASTVDECGYIIDIYTGEVDRVGTGSKGWKLSSLTVKRYRGDTQCKQCAAVNNCSSGYANVVGNCGTTGSNGYTLGTKTENNYYGNGQCTQCKAKTCPSGYSTSYQSVSDCGSSGSNGWGYTSSGYSGEKKCGKCTAKTCTPNTTYATKVANCGTTGSSGYTIGSSVSCYAGNTKYYTCTAKTSCPSGSSTSYTSTSKCGYVSTTGASVSRTGSYLGEAACYECSCSCSSSTYKYQYVTGEVGTFSGRCCNGMYSSCTKSSSSCTESTHPYATSQVQGVKSYESCSNCGTWRYKATDCNDTYYLVEGKCKSGSSSTPPSSSSSPCVDCTTGNKGCASYSDTWHCCTKCNSTITQDRLTDPVLQRDNSSMYAY